MDTEKHISAIYEQNSNKKKPILNVLVLQEFFERHERNFNKTLTKQVTDLYDVKFHFIFPMPIDIEGCLEAARDICRTRDIHVLLCSEDSAAFIAAILAKEFPHLKAANFEMIFLCQHKFYTHNCIDTSKRPIKTIAIDFTDWDLDAECERVRQKVGYPCIVKPCLGTTSYGLFRCADEVELRDALKRHAGGMSKDLIQLFVPLIKDHVDLEKYPMAINPSVIVQEFIDQFQEDKPRGRIYETEIMACNKELITFPPLEVVYLPYGANSRQTQFPGLQFPPQRPQHLIQKLKDAMERDARKMMEMGFDNGILHGEYFLFDDGDVKMLELNPRLFQTAREVYLRTLEPEGGDNVSAFILVQMGHRPTPPVPNGQYAILHWIALSKDGPIADFIDFPEARKIPEVGFNTWEEEEYVKEAGTAFGLVAHLAIAGEDFKDCAKKMHNIKKRILKTPQYFPNRTLLEVLPGELEC